jgi:hypothetical protein
MANKIDSNLTGLRYADETALGVVPGGAVWKPLEPNSYGDYGSNVTTTARAPISQSRQKQKGVVTDLDASGAFESDLTLDNMYDLFQGFFFADWRKKDVDVVTAASATVYTVAAGGTDYRANDLVFGKNFSVAANNGVHLVSASTATTVSAGGLAIEAGPPATAQIQRIGFQFAAGDAGITVTAGVVALVAVAKNLTELGVIPGEWLYIGGDLAPEQFATAANKGFCRVATIAPTKITFDKTQNVFVADAGATKTIRVYVGDVLKNESDPTLIKQRSYQLERSLGAAGYEYLKGSVPNELTLQLSGQSKVTANLSFVGMSTEEVLSGARKSGTFPALTTSNVAFNTANDFSRLRLDRVDNTGLASYMLEASLKISNGVTPVKALATLGAVDVSLGDFAVSGDVTVYFNDIAAIAAVKSNADMSLDFALVSRNMGMVIDMPLLAMSNGRLQVVKDAPIKMPVSLDGAAHATLNHTLLVTNFGYLPTIADA